MDKKSNPKHLLIIRLSAMGDVAMVVHAVRALRREYPTMRISILTRELFTPLFDGLNVEIIHADIYGRHKGIFGIMRLAGEIADLGVDLVADLHSVLRTTLLRTFLNLYRIPSARIHKSRVRKWMRIDGGCNDVTQPLKHTVARYCDVLRKVGLSFDNAVPSTKVARPNPISPEKGAQRWVGVAPFSAHRGKTYPEHHVRTLIEELSARYDRVFVHSGGGEELKFAEEMESAYPNVMAVYSKVKLAQEIELIANLDCMVSMDSFAMHICSLTATSVVSVWGATHPALGFSGFGCNERGIIQRDLPCRPCSTFGNKQCRFGDYHCLEEITPHEIVERVGELCGGSGC